jgi:hypothetical protein
MQPRPRLPGHIASRVVVLQIASQDGAERAELAQTLQEGVLPPRLPEIPGLQVTARYVAAVRGLRFSGLPRCVPVECGERGLVVGDVCGKGSGCQEYGSGPFHPATRSACCGVRLAPHNRLLSEPAHGARQQCRRGRRRTPIGPTAGEEIRGPGVGAQHGRATGARLLRVSSAALSLDCLHLASLAALGQPGDDAVAAVFGDAQARSMPRNHILGRVKFAAEFWK